MPRYHVDVGDGFPDDAVIPVGKMYLRLTYHAQNSAKRKKYLNPGERSLNVPSCITVSQSEVFEYDPTDGGGCGKICVRQSYDSTRDIIYAILLDGSIGDPSNTYTVKTVWVNSCDDTHDTLRTEQYVS